MLKLLAQPPTREHSWAEWITTRSMKIVGGAFDYKYILRLNKNTEKLQYWSGHTHTDPRTFLGGARINLYITNIFLILFDYITNIVCVCVVVVVIVVVCVLDIVFEFTSYSLRVYVTASLCRCETTSDQYWQAYIRSTNIPITLPP